MLLSVALDHCGDALGKRRHRNGGHFVFVGELRGASRLNLLHNLNYTKEREKSVSTHHHNLRLSVSLSNVFHCLTLVRLG